MYIINYSTSGLGNRLRPLASCFAAAKVTGRKVLAYWDNITPNGCLAKWDELFENPLDLISLEELKNLDDCALYTEKPRPGSMCHGCEREWVKFGRDALKHLATKYPAQPTKHFRLHTSNKHIIVYENNFLEDTSIPAAHDYLRSLRPIESIRKAVEHHANTLNLNKNIYGIHARGTDSHSDLGKYIAQIEKHLRENSNRQFFISTEDPDFERTITNKFPNNILYRKKKHYIVRNNPSTSWDDHNGFYITKEHAQEAIEDLYLLAKTNIQIHSGSSFGELARIIS